MKKRWTILRQEVIDTPFLPFLSHMQQFCCSWILGMQEACGYYAISGQNDNTLVVDMSPTSLISEK